MTKAFALACVLSSVVTGCVENDAGDSSITFPSDGKADGIGGRRIEVRFTAVNEVNSSGKTKTTVTSESDSSITLSGPATRFLAPKQPGAKLALSLFTIVDVNMAFTLFQGPPEAPTAVTCADAGYFAAPMIVDYGAGELRDGGSNRTHTFEECGLDPKQTLYVFPIPTRSGWFKVNRSYDYSISSYLH